MEIKCLKSLCGVTCIDTKHSEVICDAIHVLQESRSIATLSAINTLISGWSCMIRTTLDTQMPGTMIV